MVCDIPMAEPQPLFELPVRATRRKDNPTYFMVVAANGYLLLRTLQGKPLTQEIAERLAQAINQRMLPVMFNGH